MTDARDEMNAKFENLYVRFAAERVAKDFLQKDPEAPRSVEELKAQALANPRFVARARAHYRYRMLSTDALRG
jgi:hypothetical protein